MRLSSWLRSAGSLFATSGTEQGHRPARLAKRAPPTRLSVEQLDDRIAPSTFTVLNLADGGPGSLRAAIQAANTSPGADVIDFAPGLNGTIGLTGGQLDITDALTINGPGASVLAVSGNDASRVFQVTSGVTVAMTDLTITHGRAEAQGGGILNAGNLTLSDVVLSENQAIGLPAGNASGGGIRNSGTLTVSHSIFVRNQSLGAAGSPGVIGGTGLGGAIASTGTLSAPATATVSHSTFLDNQAIAGAGGVGARGGSGVGGAIMNDAGTFTVSHSVFRRNQAVGGAGGSAGASGFGAGGAIINVARNGDAMLVVTHSTLTDNRAVGGPTGTGSSPQIGRGGGIANLVSPQATLDVTPTAVITHSTLSGNQAVGGDGGAGGSAGTGQGGGIANERGGILTLIHST
jgi:hypothetical protein